MDYQPTITPVYQNQINHSQLVAILIIVVIALLIIFLAVKTLLNLRKYSSDQPEIKKSRRNLILIDFLIWIFLSIIPAYFVFGGIAACRNGCDSIGAIIFIGIAIWIPVTIIMEIIALMHSNKR